MSTDKKFEQFEKAVKAKEVDVILCSNLCVLGDTVEEVTRNIQLALKEGKNIICAEEDIFISSNPNK